jgi:hypothetical protein
VRIALATLTGGAQEQAEQLFALAHDDAEPEAFTVDISKAIDVIKSNAFPTEPPSEGAGALSGSWATSALPRWRQTGRSGLARQRRVIMTKLAPVGSERVLRARVLESQRIGDISWKNPRDRIAFSDGLF